MLLCMSTTTIGALLDPFSVSYCQGTSVYSFCRCVWAYTGVNYYLPNLDPGITMYYVLASIPGRLKYGLVPIAGVIVRMR